MSRPDTAIDIGPFHFTHCSYDAGNDVAYLSIGAPRAGIAWESPEGHLIRVDPDPDELVGVTFLHARPCIEAGELLITFPDSVLPADRSPKESRKATRVPPCVLASRRT
jgi:hypothetical protein